jgi:large subunit ribosomal protein L24
MSKAKLKLKKGDQVIVLTGKSKGTKGEILKVLREEERVLVAGVNVVKKHTKPSQSGPGGIENVERSVHISNVALADPKTGKPTRVGYKTLKDGKKMRVAKRSGETIE